MDKALEKQKFTKKRHSERAKDLLVKRIIWFCIVFDVFVIDQISKWYISEMVIRPRVSGQGDSLGIVDWYMNAPPILPYSYIEITSFFNIVMAWNTGVSFSMFSNYGAYMPYILVAFALGIVGMFTMWLMNTKRHMHGICYALIIGGALGNIIDRVRFSAVIDFLDFHLMGYHWPSFNVADMAVVSGVSMLIIGSLLFKSK